MKSLHQFIVGFDQRYNNHVDVEGKELIINTEITERDAEYVNRVATVVAIPTAYDTPIKVGDQIIVHHNVARRWYDKKQREKNSHSYIDDDHFMVYWDQIFAYKQGGIWTSYPGFLFCKPIFEATQWETIREVPLKGIIGMKNHHGLKVDQVVGFTPESEYEFRFDDDIWYRVYAHDITILYYGLKKGEETHHSFRRESVEGTG